MDLRLLLITSLLTLFVSANANNSTNLQCLPKGHSCDTSIWHVGGKCCAGLMCAGGIVGVPATCVSEAQVINGIKEGKLKVILNQTK